MLSLLNGSSPRAWRQLAIVSGDFGFRRFISTCVETAFKLELHLARRKVHLHVRGDSEFRFGADSFACGSSPRAWRQLSFFCFWVRPFRFISTCVETAFVEKSSTAQESVHLHVRGDSSAVGLAELCIEGSSPRAWRQRVRLPATGLPPRFISTCVETASGDAVVPTPVSVHLHVRGDSCGEISTPENTSGSSPRAWRQLRFQPLSRRERRFISTCVETAYGGRS